MDQDYIEIAYAPFLNSLIDANIHPDDLYNLEKFLVINTSLPYELNCRIFKHAFWRFYQLQLLELIQYPELRPLLNTSFNELLISDGKLFFGEFNEYDVIKFDSAEYELLKSYILHDIILIETLKVFDCDRIPEDECKLLLRKSKTIWAANEGPLLDMSKLDPECLVKITDLLVENEHDLDMEVFASLLPGLKELTLPLNNHFITQEVWSVLKDLQHKVQLHLPLSFYTPNDEFGPGSSAVETFVDTINSEINYVPDLFFLRKTFILYGLMAVANSDLGMLHEFVTKQYDPKSFNDLRLILMPGVKPSGDLSFIPQMSNLVTIVISGNFELNNATVGNISRLLKLRELQLDSCMVSVDWLNGNIPSNCQEISIRYSTLIWDVPTFFVPNTLKTITILEGTFQDIDLTNFDLSNACATVLKFRLREDKIQKNHVSGKETVYLIRLNTLPALLAEINFYKLTDLIVEKDVKFVKKYHDLRIEIYLEQVPPRRLNLNKIKSLLPITIYLVPRNGKTKTKLAEIEKTNSIGGLPPRIMELT